MNFINFKKLGRSFTDAFRGFRFFRTEQNLKIQLLAAAIIIILMFVYPLGLLEKMVLIIVISAVLVTEMTNTIMEKVIDHLHPGHHENIALIKNAMASVVLSVSILSIIVGVIIFWPYIF